LEAAVRDVADLLLLDTPTGQVKTPATLAPTLA
jgi:hypothetical protein